MNKQIKCLDKSINKKWIPIVNGRKEIISTDNYCGCECCRMYFKDGCFGCPIYEDTERRRCYGTPHEYYIDLAHELETNIYDLMFDLKAAAQMELSYLIDLRDRLKGQEYEREQIEDARPEPGKDDMVSMDKFK